MQEKRAENQEKEQRRGCLTGCITPIAVIFVIILVIGVIGYSKLDAFRRILLKRIIANTQDHILSDLPLDIDENEIEATFEKLKLALKEDRVDTEALTKAIEEYHNVVKEKPPPARKKQAIDTLMESLTMLIATPTGKI